MKIWQLVLLLIAVKLLATTAVTTAATDDGRQLYLSHCSRCHGMDGQGFRRLYPSLHGSPYFTQELMQLPCIIVNGLTGTIRLQDGTYNRTMPGNKLLNANQIALLMQYSSRFSTGNTIATTTINFEEVERLLLQCQ